MSSHESTEERDEDRWPEPSPARSEYTAAHAEENLQRASRLVVILAGCGLPVAWYLQGWQSALLLVTGALISASGLWEWQRLMRALTARMEEHDRAASAGEKAASPSAAGSGGRPSIAFAVAGFVVRLLVVLVVLYVSLKYLHGSVFALAAGLALGIVALTVEALRLLRSGTI